MTYQLPTAILKAIERAVERGEIPRPSYTSISDSMDDISLANEMSTEKQPEEPYISLANILSNEQTPEEPYISLAKAQADNALANTLANEMSVAMRPTHAAHADKEISSQEGHAAHAANASLHSAHAAHAANASLHSAHAANSGIPNSELPELSSITRMKVQVFRPFQDTTGKAKYRNGFRNLKVCVWTNGGNKDSERDAVVYFNLTSPTEFKRAVKRNMKTGAIDRDTAELLTYSADQVAEFNIRTNTRLEQRTIAYLTVKGAGQTKGTRIVPTQMAILKWEKDEDGETQASVDLYRLDTMEETNTTCPKSKPKNSRNPEMACEYIGYYDPEFKKRIGKED